MVKVPRNVVISDELHEKRRLRNKQAVLARPLPRRSFSLAWEDYRNAHVVSEHAVRLIKSFLLTQVLESAEAFAEEETAKAKEPLVPISTAWASLETITDILGQQGPASHLVGKQRRNSEAVGKAKSLTRQIWGHRPDPEATGGCIQVSKAGDVTLGEKLVDESAPERSSRPNQVRVSDRVRRLVAELQNRSVLRTIVVALWLHV